MEIIFWSSIAILVFIYIGYGPLLSMLSFFGFNYKSKGLTMYNQNLPEVSIAIAAFNEEDFIEDKLKNTLQLDYPKSKLKIYVVSDGSSDKTNKIVQQFDQVNLLFKPERKGKIHAMNRAMDFIDSQITIFTDANCFINKEAVMNIVKQFNDPEIGAVSGEKQIWTDSESKVNAQGEGLYWKMEAYLKKLDFKFYSVVGAAGELFAIRTGLFEKVESDTVLDDFAITLKINLNGYRTAYAPDAYAIETASESTAEEFKRKVRISTGGFQLFFRFLTKINPIKHTRLFFQYYVHRVSRWVLAPLALLLAFFMNAILAFNDTGLYFYIFLTQIAFYSIALFGYFFKDKILRIKVLLVPFYFSFMHLAVIVGFYRFLFKKQNGVWKKSKRVTHETASTKGLFA